MEFRFIEHLGGGATLILVGRRTSCGSSEVSKSTSQINGRSHAATAAGLLRRPHRPTGLYIPPPSCCVLFGSHGASFGGAWLVAQRNPQAAWLTRGVASKGDKRPSSFRFCLAPVYLSITSCSLLGWCFGGVLIFCNYKTNPHKFLHIF